MGNGIIKRIGRGIKGRVREGIIERKRMKAAEKIIKQKSIAAGLRERERQSIKFAEEKEKFKAQSRLRTFRSGGLFRQRFRTPPLQPTVFKHRKRKGKRRKRRATRRQAPIMREQTSLDFANIIP